MAKIATMQATSADIAAGKTYIVLYWKKAEATVGYNLYRKEKSAASFPTTPLNGGKPIASVKTCDELKAIIPEGSAEWDMLKKAFSSLSVKEQTKSKADAAKPKGYFEGQLLQEKDFKDEQVYQIDKKAFSPLASIGKLRPDLALAMASPCTALQRGLTATEGALLDTMATANLKIRLARGLGFIDKGVTAHKWYVYELRGVKPDGTEIVLAQDVQIQAGHYLLPGPPSSISATAGDRKALILWDRNQLASSYVVGRSTSASGSYQQVHSESIFYDVEQDLDGNEITPPKPGLVDYQRWSEEGLPISHDVVTLTGTTISVDGPANYVTYYYKVASVDILGRQGSWSGYQSTMPVDKTSPKAPDDLKVDPSSSPVGLALSWRKVNLDVNGHQEFEITQTYNIYRADTLDALENVTALTTASGYFVHSMTANPTDPATMTLSWTDTDTSLVPAYGEKDFWYRIQCVDTHNNVSSPSAAVSGRAPDTTPPGPTKVTGAEGHADHITTFWEPNAEPDLAGYQIYQSVCDRGKPYRPGQGRQDYKEDPRTPCDFSLVGELLVSEANKRLAETGRIYYDDYSLPVGSPICYAYWVRAFDMARNLYPGKWGNGCPDKGEYVCQRLYEETPPPVPIISGLKARNNSVLVEWISSPIQDLRAFHVYRSEKETDPPTFVGCVLNDGTIWPGKWVGMKPACEDIPAEPDPTTVKGSFEDKGLEPNKVYWYRVSAVDWLGNESESADLTKVPAISTFTYSKDLPETPVVLPPSGTTTTGCGLVVRWTPSFDPATLDGFLVFRSTSATGPYRQVSPIVKSDEFVDESALRDTDYWYRVQAIDKMGKLSEPSAAVKYRY